MSIIKKYYKLIIISLVTFIMYLPTFIWMWDRWFKHESYYSHGILMPFLVGLLIYFKKDELKGLRPVSSKLGLIFLVPALLIHMFSAAKRVYFTSGFSLILLILGLILFFLGKEYFKKLFWPVMFLVFMVPMPLVFIANISVKMKLLAAHVSTMLLNKIGVPAIRMGSVIKTPNAALIVANPCSGLRSLISLLALGGLVAYFMQTHVIKKWLLIVLSIPIALCANIFRITLLTFVSEVYGEEFAMGWFHDFSGFLLFFVALIGLMIVKKVLE